MRPKHGVKLCVEGEPKLDESTRMEESVGGTKGERSDDHWCELICRSD